jgi:predicted dehydrogenase
MARVAVVGLGYWGPNLLRTFNNLDALAGAFDQDYKKVNKFAKDPAYSEVFFDTDWERCLGRSDVDGVVIATPPDTHYNIAMKALLAGKHVFVEKPMTLKVHEAEKILQRARDVNRVVLVGHIFLYSPEIIKLKELVDKPAFGDIYYVYTQRLNLGKIQSPANVIQDLAPHDISIIDYLIDSRCVEAQAFGKAHILETEDVAFLNLKYENGVIAHLHLSWLDPLKVRNTVVVGTKQMIVCDSAAKKIELYNKRVNINKRQHVSNQSYADHLMSYKYGDVISPYIDNYEPMAEECKDFLRCMDEGLEPVAHGSLGVEVVKVLTALQKSVKGSGKWVSV